MRPGVRDLAVAGIRCLPLPVVAALAWVLTWTWWTVLPIRKRVAVDNFSRALPHEPRPGRVLRHMLYSVLLGYVELDRMVRHPERAGETVRMEGVEALVARCRTGEPTLCLAGHFGAWDLILSSFGQVPGLSLTCVVRPPADAWSAAYIEHARSSLGVGLLPPRDSKERVYDLLRGGNVVLLPFDQRQNDGVRVPFFGRPAATMAAPAAFARRTRVPVWLLTQWREGIGRHGLRFTGPIELTWTDDREADIARVSEAFNRLYEEAIRARPQDWWWMHRRWA